MKKNTVFVILMFIITLCFGYSSINISTNNQFSMFYSQANGAIAKYLTFSMLLDQLEGSLKRIIEKAGVEARYTIFVAAQNLLTIISEIRRAASDIIDKTFDRLDNTWKNIAIDLNNQIKELDNAITQNIKNIDGIVTKFDMIVSRLPFTKKDPRIYKYSPQYILKKSDEVYLKLNGSLLSYNEPFIKVNKERFLAEKKTDTELIFKLPLNVFSNNNTTKIDSTKLELIIFKKKKKPLSKPKFIPVSYSLLIFSVPNQLGSYTIKVTESTSRVETKGKGGFVDLSSDWWDSRSIAPVYHTEDGWLIRTESISWNPHHNNHGAFHGFHDVTQRSFSAHFSARPFGNHNKTLRIKGEKGHISGDVKYTIYKTVSVNRTFDFGNGALFWETDKIFNFPPNTISYTITVDTLNGQRIIMTSARNNYFFNCEYDNVSNKFVIHPKNPQSALTRE